MPTFPDGSRVWINDADGKPLEEYQPQVEVNEAERTHLITVFIESEKDKEFSVGYNMSKPPTGDLRAVELRVDGKTARSSQVRKFGRDSGFEGWLVDSTTTERFAFGEVETSEACEPGSYERQKEQLLGASIEVDFVDAILSAEPINVQFGKPKAAGPVHPDSKVATLVGVSVKAGTKLRAAVTLAKRRAVQRAGCFKYMARFLYRPQGFLVGAEIMPDPDPASHNNEAEAESSASANAKKRKRKEVAAAPAAGSSAAGGESAEERKKRLRAELIAIKKELGEDIDGAPPRPMLGNDDDDANLKVKPEPELDPSRPQNQKIFFDLSADTDSDSDA